MFRTALVPLIAYLPLCVFCQETADPLAAPPGGASQAPSAASTPVDETAYENPVSVPVTSILRKEELKGRNFDVGDYASSDGMFYSFIVQSAYGQYRPRSLQMLRVRLAEMHAMEALTRLEKEPLFLKGATEQIADTVDATGNAIMHPIETVRKVPLGFAKFKNDIQARQEMGKVYGESGSMGIQIPKRKLAHQLGVNPYTDNRQLQEQLNRVARNKNYGALAASIGTWFVPGGAGIALGVIDMNDDFSSQLRDNSAAEIQVQNRKILDAIGCDTAQTDAFLKRPGYTAAHSGAICQSLMRLGKVRGSCQFLSVLPEWPGPEGALFCQTQIEMAAAYHARVEPLASMRIAATTPLFESVSGKPVLFIPLDRVHWNAELHEQLRSLHGESPNGAQIWIVGTVTDSARRNAEALGFSFRENALATLKPTAKKP